MVLALRGWEGDGPLSNTLNKGVYNISPLFIRCISIVVYIYCRNVDHSPEVQGVHHGAGHALLHLPHAVGADGELLFWQLDADDASSNRAKLDSALVGGPKQTSPWLKFHHVECCSVGDGD